MLDVQTNGLYAFGEGQGEATTTTALAYVDNDELIRDSRTDSLDKLGQALFADLERQVWDAASRPRATGTPPDPNRKGRP